MGVANAARRTSGVVANDRDLGLAILGRPSAPEMAVSCVVVVAAVIGHRPVVLEGLMSLVRILDDAHELYRSTSRMLRASEPLLEERGYAPYANWPVREPLKLAYHDPTTWFAHRVVRQFYPRERKNCAILTLGAVLWHPTLPHFDTALCIASFIEVAGTNSNDVYGVPLLQIHAPGAPPDGQVRELRPDDIDSDELRDTFRSLVPSTRLTSVAVPLETITSTEHLGSALITPLLAHLATRDAAAPDS